MGTDYLLVGFKGKSRLNLDYAKRKISHARKSNNISLSDPRLLYRLIVSEDLQGLFGQGPVNTDSRPRLEFAAPKLIYHNDPTIRRNIRFGKRVDDGTRAIVRKVTADLDAQIDFAAFALSVHEPFQNMVDLTKASPSQIERLIAIVETYCTNNALNASVLKDETLMRRCRLAQIETLQSKMDHLPDKAHSYAYLGKLYKDISMPDRAIASYSRSLKIEPDKASTHNYLGALLAQHGKLDKAVTHFKAALRINPNSAEARNNLGYAFGQKGELKEALSHFTKALQLDPGAAEAQKNLGLVLARLGKLDDSEREYLKALQMDPDNPHIYYELGIVLSRLGKTEEAERFFARAQQKKARQGQ
jgi:spermidine synthase